MRFDGKKKLTIQPIFKDIRNNFTYEFWVKPDATHKIRKESVSGASGISGQRYVIGAGHGLDKEYAGTGVSVGTNGVSVFEHTAYHLPATLVFETSITDWIHIAIVFHDKTPYLFINGELKKKGLKSLKSNVFASGIIGGLNDYDCFIGELTFVRIWDHARTRKQINENMSKEITDKKPGLIENLVLNENRQYNEKTSSNDKSNTVDLKSNERKDINKLIRVNKTDTGNIDVIICVHNALEEVKVCLESLIAKKTLNFNIIIVDDGSNKETSRYLRTFAKVYNCKLIRNDLSQGYTVAANQGLLASSLKYCVLLNSDTVVTLRWLEKLIACMESEKDVGIVGPLSNAATWQSVPKLFEQNNWVLNLLPEKMSLEQMSNLVENQSVKCYPEVPIINGFCLMVKRDVLEKIGYFDQQIFYEGYGEENDYCIRAHNAGFKLKVADDCYVYHHRSRSYTGDRIKLLKKQADKLICRKYSSKKIKECATILREKKELNTLRKKVGNAIENDEKLKRHNISILFILPTKGGDGGSHSVVQETMGLRSMNVNAKIANKLNYKIPFEDNYRSSDEFCVYYKSQDELIRLSQHFDIVVATVFTTIKTLKNIIECHPYIKPAYYIQDYEPLLFRNDHHWYKEAIESYTLIPNINAFAKTNWICKIIKENHGTDVYKIVPSLDNMLFKPDLSKKNNKNVVHIVAMVRPKTLRRSPEKTMDLLKKIKGKYKSKVEISIFGCTDNELKSLNVNLNFDFNNHGKLHREHVAELLQHSDIFIDLSTYQAFGRTGLEAMAVGCSVILPKLGGADEYAVHGYNSFLVDTNNNEEVIRFTSNLVENKSIRNTFLINGIETAKNYSIEKASLAQYQFFYNIINNST
jgi:GT2 family glycosyltransferase/glycosyltransferase involved in cell wall biosynthesis